MLIGTSLSLFIIMPSQIWLKNRLQTIMKTISILKSRIILLPKTQHKVLTTTIKIETKVLAQSVKLVITQSTKSLVASKVTMMHHSSKATTMATPSFLLFQPILPCMPWSICQQIKRMKAKVVRSWAQLARPTSRHQIKRQSLVKLPKNSIMPWRKKYSRSALSSQPCRPKWSTFRSFTSPQNTKSSFKMPDISKEFSKSERSTHSKTRWALIIACFRQLGRHNQDKSRCHRGLLVASRGP